MLVQGVRASLVLGAVAMACASTLSALLLGPGGGFFASNLMEPDRRNLVLLLGLLAFAMTAAWSLLLTVVEPGGHTPGLDRLARKLCPLLLLPLAAALAHHGFGEDVETAIALGLFALAAERLARVSLTAFAEDPRPWRTWLATRASAPFSRPGLPLIALAVLVAGHAVFMSVYAVWAHQRFATYGYDLGQYDQVFQSVLQGQPLRLASLGWDHVWGGLNGHADLATFFLLPVYALHPRASTLLVMQAVLLAVAAFPVFAIARRRLGPGWAFLLAVGWLVYPPIHGAQLYDIHMQPFGAVFVLFAIAAVDAGRWRTYWVFFTMAILCREDVSIGLAALGAFLFLSGTAPRTGVASSIIATAYFLLLRFVLMRNQGFADTYKLLYPLGEAGFGAVIKTMITNPAFTLKSLLTWEKVRYVFQIFAPLAFLPVRRPLLWVLFIPGFILTLLSTAYLPTIQISFQYVCNWAPYIFTAAAVVLGGMQERWRHAAMLSVVAAMTAASLQWGAYSFRPTVKGGFSEVPFQPPGEADLQREKDLQDLMTQVPRDAALCAADRLQPHVTYHLHTWSLRDTLADCEFLLYSDLPNDMGNLRGSQAVASGQYRVVETRPGLYLARKVRPAP